MKLIRANITEKEFDNYEVNFYQNRRNNTNNPPLDYTISSSSVQPLTDDKEEASNLSESDTNQKQKYLAPFLISLLAGSIIATPSIINFCKVKGAQTVTHTKIEDTNTVMFEIQDKLGDQDKVLETIQDESVKQQAVFNKLGTTVFDMKTKISIESRHGVFLEGLESNSNKVVYLLNDNLKKEIKKERTDLYDIRIVSNKSISKILSNKWRFKSGFSILMMTNEKIIPPISIPDSIIYITQIKGDKIRLRESVGSDLDGLITE